MEHKFYNVTHFFISISYWILLFFCSFRYFFVFIFVTSYYLMLTNPSRDYFLFCFWMIYYFLSCTGCDKSRIQWMYICTPTKLLCTPRLWKLHKVCVRQYNILLHSFVYFHPASFTCWILFCLFVYLNLSTWKSRQCLIVPLFLQYWSNLLSRHFLCFRFK